MSDLNTRWCLWLMQLDQRQYRRVMADELFYFDAVRSGNMSPTEVLRHAMRGVDACEVELAL